MNVQLPDYPETIRVHCQAHRGGECDRDEKPNLHPSSAKLSIRLVRSGEADNRTGGHCHSGQFCGFCKTNKVYILRHQADGSEVRLPFNYKKVIDQKAPDENIILKNGLDTIDRSRLNAGRFTGIKAQEKSRGFEPRSHVGQGVQREPCFDSGREIRMKGCSLHCLNEESLGDL